MIDPDEKWKQCRISCSATIMNAAQAINNGALGIALMTDANERLIATVTDGNIRRALLKGATMDEPIRKYANFSFLAVPPDTRRADVLDIMQARRVVQIPIINSEGVLIGLHTMHNMFGLERLPNCAIIMAGGRGIRLGELTNNIPKPMLRVAGRPILERLVMHLVSFGIRKIFISVHYRSEVIEEFFGHGERHGCEIIYLRETEPLGTGGSLSLLPVIPGAPLVICNGDLLTQVDFDAMLRFHAQQKSEATIGVRTHNTAIPFGVIQEKDRRIYQIEEKPVFCHLINAGVYIIEPHLLKEIPARFFPITELFDKLLREGRFLSAYSIEEEWMDIGEKDQLNKARGN